MKKTLFSGAIFLFSISLSFAETQRVTPEVLAVRNVAPSVVNISTEQVVSVNDNYNSFFGDFFPRKRRNARTASYAGSGVIIDKSGLILTNAHIVSQADDISVTVNQKQYDAKQLFSDTKSGLALLKIKVDDQELSAVKFAQAGDILLAETVLAIGNPFGNGNSISKGIVSSVEGQESEESEPLIQTDASINPGNNGGALVNLDGEVIGLNLAIDGRTNNLGNAITVKQIEETLVYWLVPMTSGMRSCGVIFDTDYSEEKGVSVSEVLMKSAAERAGLNPGDHIIQIEGKAVSGVIDACIKLWNRRFSKNVTFKLSSGKVIKVDMLEPSSVEKVRLNLGVDLEALTPQLCESLNLEKDTKGLLISDILPHSLLKQSELVSGDLILKANGSKISSVKELLEIIEDSEESITIYAIGLRKYRNRTFYKEFNYKIQLPDKKSNL